MNSSLVLKVFTKPASACLMLLLTPSLKSLRAASLASWMTAFSVAPAMIETHRFWAMRIAKGGPETMGGQSRFHQSLSGSLSIYLDRSSGDFLLIARLFQVVRDILDYDSALQSLTHGYRRINPVI